MLTNHSPYAGRAVGVLCNFIKPDNSLGVPIEAVYLSADDCLDAPDSLPHGGTRKLSGHSECSSMSYRDGWQA